MSLQTWQLTSGCKDSSSCWWLHIVGISSSILSFIFADHYALQPAGHFCQVKLNETENRLLLISWSENDSQGEASLRSQGVEERAHGVTWFVIERSRVQHSSKQTFVRSKEVHCTINSFGLFKFHWHIWKVNKLSKNSEFFEPKI
jgi:hypothetical protein